MIPFYFTPVNFHNRNSAWWRHGRLLVDRTRRTIWRVMGWRTRNWPGCNANTESWSRTAKLTAKRPPISSGSKSKTFFSINRNFNRGTYLDTIENHLSAVNTYKTWSIDCEGHHRPLALKIKLRQFIFHGNDDMKRQTIRIYKSYVTLINSNYVVCQTRQ